MTPRKKQPERRTWDDETKRKAIARLDARDQTGETAESIAAEIGAHTSTIYYWRDSALKQAAQQKLDLDEPAPEKKPRAKANGKGKNGASDLTPSEREELIALRIKVKKLQKMMAIAVDD